MQKTVNVVDETGKMYEATYVKRARGLVKSGRARFIDENTICLACPPKNLNISEDNSMTNTDNYTVNIETGEVTIPEAEVTADASSAKYTLEYFLEKIEKLTEDYNQGTQHIACLISGIESEGTPCGGSGDEVAKAAAESVRYREETVKKTLDFYFRMADELKPKSSSPMDEKMQYLNWIKECTAAAGPGVETPDYAKLWNEIK